MILYQGKFPSTQKLKNGIITLIKDKLSEIEGRICIDLFDLNLVLDEAIINAMEHGNNWDPAKNILIKISLKEKGIQIEIEDEGQGFDYFHKVVIKKLKPHLGERGRGLLLIQQLCDIEWINSGNIIQMNIPVEIGV